MINQKRLTYGLPFGTQRGQYRRNGGQHHRNTQLLQTINYNNGINVSNKRSITIDLNGFNLNVEAKMPLYVYSSEVKLTGKGEFNVTGIDSNGEGVWVSEGKATVTNVTGDARVIVSNGTLTVLGNVTSKASHGIIFAQDNSTVTVHGDVTSSDTDLSMGVRAWNNTSVTVHGNVTATGGLERSIGVEALNNGYVTVHGNVTATDNNSRGQGVTIFDNSAVTVYGNVTANSHGILTTSSGSVVKVMGDVSSSRGFGIYVSGLTEITVSGAVTSGGFSNGILACLGAVVSVSGGVTSIDDYAVRSNDGAKVSVTGDVTGKGGVTVYNDAILTVYGNVTAINGRGVSADNNGKATITGDIIGPVWARNQSNVMITGNVTVDGVDATNWYYAGVDVQVGAKVTIDGVLKVPNDWVYIACRKDFTDAPFFLTPADNQPTSSKVGYLEYTDGINYVWVEGSHTGTDIILQPSTLKTSLRNGCLHVNGLTIGELCTVYSLSGMTVYQNMATAKEIDISLPTKGMYIIVSAGQSLKLFNY